MTTTINASTSNGLVQTADGSGILKVQSNGVTTNALAWVNFNGTTSPGTIRAQYNVSSVTKNATGNYTLNFTNTLSDANYVVVACGNNAQIYNNIGATMTTSAVQVLAYYTITLTDVTIQTVAIFGN